MRQSELYKLLCSIGLEVYFYEADQNPTLPYIVYLKDGETAWGSDSRNFLRKDSYIVELYSARKDFANQEKIEKALDSVGIRYDATEIYIEKEKMYLVTFATVYKGNIIKNLIMDCQSYTKYRPNETTGGIFVSWRRKEELPTGA